MVNIMKKTIISILIGTFCISPLTSLKAGVSFGGAISPAVTCLPKGLREPHASSAVTVKLKVVETTPATSSPAKGKSGIRTVMVYDNEGLLENIKKMPNKGEAFKPRKVEESEIRKIMSRMSSGDFSFNVLIEENTLFLGFVPNKVTPHEDLLPFHDDALRGVIDYTKKEMSIYLLHTRLGEEPEAYSVRERLREMGKIEKGTKIIDEHFERYRAEREARIADELIRTARLFVEYGFPSSFPLSAVLMKDYKDHGFFDTVLVTIGELAQQTLSTESPATSSPAANTGGIDLDGDYLDIDTRKIKGGFRTRPYIMGDIEGLTFDILQVREYRP